MTPLAILDFAPVTVRRTPPQTCIERHRPDELILTDYIVDHAARVRSYEPTMEAWTS